MSSYHKNGLSASTDGQKAIKSQAVFYSLTFFRHNRTPCMGTNAGICLTNRNCYKDSHLYQDVAFVKEFYRITACFYDLRRS